MIVRHEAVYVRRRRVALALLAVLALLMVLLVDRVFRGAGQAGASTRGAHPVPAASHPSSTSSQPQTTSPTAGAPTGASSSAPSSGTSTASRPSSAASTTAPARAGAAGVQLLQVRRISAARTPQSLTAAPTGGIFAQGAGDRHSVTAYLPTGAVAGTISDTVDLGKFKIPGHPGLSLGAPEAAAFAADGSNAYVANSSMTGNGFPGPSASCSAALRSSSGYLYRVNATDLAVDKVLPTGPRSTAVAAAADGSVLSTSGCTDDLWLTGPSGGGSQPVRIALHRTPTALAVAPDSHTAYVALDGGGVARVDLRSHAVSRLQHTGGSPVALVLSRDGHRLFAADGSGRVTRVDLGSGGTRSVTVGESARALALSADGTALYVAGGAAKGGPSGGKGTRSATGLLTLATSDLSVQQRYRTPTAAVSVAYEPTTRRVWLACSGGAILVLGPSPSGTSTAR